MLLHAVRHGVDANAQNSRGYTPLLYAAKLGDLAAVRELLSAGADVNAVELDGWTALMLVVEAGHPQVKYPPQMYSTVLYCSHLLYGLL